MGPGKFAVLVFLLAASDRLEVNALSCIGKTTVYSITSDVDLKAGSSSTNLPVTTLQQCGSYCSSNAIVGGQQFDCDSYVYKSINQDCTLYTGTSVSATNGIAASPGTILYQKLCIDAALPAGSTSTAQASSTTLLASSTSSLSASPSTISSASTISSTPTPQATTEFYLTASSSAGASTPAAPATSSVTAQSVTASSVATPTASSSVATPTASSSVATPTASSSVATPTASSSPLPPATTFALLSSSTLPPGPPGSSSSVASSTVLPLITASSLSQSSSSFSSTSASPASSSISIDTTITASLVQTETSATAFSSTPISTLADPSIVTGASTYGGRANLYGRNPVPGPCAGKVDYISCLRNLALSGSSTPTAAVGA